MNIFILSFIPLGVWVMFWLYRAVASVEVEQTQPGLGFVIPTAVYGGFQVWLALRAFRA